MNFYHRFSQAQLRPDGRAFTEARPTSVGTGVLSTCAGSATARVGGTVVTAGVSASPLRAAALHLHAQGPSLLDCRVTVSSGSSPRYRGRGGGEALARGRELTAFAQGVLRGAQGGAEGAERAAFLSTLQEAPQLASLPAPVLEGLQRLVPRSGLVRLSSLRLPSEGEGGGAGGAMEGGEEGGADAAARLEAALQQRVRAFWTLCVDAVVVADDGGVEDALVLAVTAALASLELPCAAGAGAGGAEGGAAGGAVGGGAGAGQRLQLRALPVATTFALLPGEGGSSSSSSSSGESSSAGLETAPVLCVADPSVSNGEDLAPQLQPLAADSGGGGGVGAALSLAGLGARGLAGAHFTLVCDAARAEAAGAEVLALRKLGGLALSTATLQAASAVAAARARACLALIS